jgi:hypothetical protein
LERRDGQRSVEQLGEDSERKAENVRREEGNRAKEAYWLEQQ